MLQNFAMSWWQLVPFVFQRPSFVIHVKSLVRVSAGLVFFGLSAGCTPNLGPPTVIGSSHYESKRPHKYQEVLSVERGKASFYHDSLHNRRTASGERYRKDQLTAAHRTLPFGSKVRVRNLRNGKRVIVRINDRGPFIRGRIIDLSRSAARELGMIQGGVAPVEIEVLSAPRGALKAKM